MTNSSKKEREEKAKKDRHLASVLLSAPLWAAVIHLLGNVFLITRIGLQEGSSVLTGTESFSVLFGAGELSLLLVGSSRGLTAVKSIVSIFDIVMGLLLLFLAYYGTKGKKRCAYLALGAYGIDTVLMMAALILGPRQQAVTMRTVEYVVPPILHVLTLVLTGLALYFQRRAEKEEEPQGLYVSNDPNLR